MGGTVEAAVFIVYAGVLLWGGGRRAYLTNHQRHTSVSY